MRLEFEIPIRTRSETNIREHWRARHRRRKEQRNLAALFTRQWLDEPIPGPYRITLIRLAPRKLDSDNLASSAKAIRDGIADALGIDDGDEAHRWEYEQAQRREYGVGVRIEGGGSK